MKPYRVILADDHVLLRQGLKRIIESVPGFQVAGEAGDGLELLKLLDKRDADLLIVDISMPHLRGIEAAAEIRKVRPRIKILVLTMHKETEFVREAISAGADGYLLKENADTDLFSAIEKIREGRMYVSPSLSEDLLEGWPDPAQAGAEPLTLRERQVLKMIAEGKTSREIAGALFISMRTADRHRSNIMEKLKMRKTAELVKYAIRKGYV